MFSKILRSFKNSAGFTLLEIIVVFSVIAIIATVGIAAFVNYSKIQTLQTAYLDLKNTLSIAKSYSQSQLKPTECSNVLNGYEVDLDLFNGKYSLVAKCQGYDKNLKTVSFPTNIKFNNSLTTTSTLLFPILSNNMASCNSSCTITIQRYEGTNPQDSSSEGNCKVITIDNLGGIR